MADNVRGGSTDTGLALIATDDVAGVQFQKVKLDVGGDGASTPVVGTLPVSGTVSVTEPVSVDDNGASLTVDGTVAVSTLPALVAGSANIGDVDVLSVPAPLSTSGGGTEATALRVTLASDSTGLVSVDDNAGSLTVDVTVAVSSLPALVASTANIWDVDILTVPAPLSTTGGGTEATAHRVTIANDSTGVVSVDDNGGSLTVDGTVAVSTLPASTNTIEVVGDAAHDAAAAGNPLLNAGSHETMADSAPTNRLATVTDGDVQRLSTTDGALFVIPTGPQIWSYHENSSSALTDAVVHAAPGAGLSLYVTDIVVSTGAATALNVFFEEGASTVLGPWYLEAVAGRGLAVHFGTPKKITTNTALTITTSAAIAHGIDATGFIAPG